MEKEEKRNKKCKISEEGGERKEGSNLLGPPTFKEMDNGRFKCIETGQEMPKHAMDSYAKSKQCRLGLIDAALSHNKPPLNMFTQDPSSCSKLICKLTGDTINKSEEHIWKHINGKRFLNKLEQKEAEKITSNGTLAEQTNQMPGEVSKLRDNRVKKKKKKQEKEVVSQIVSKARKSSDEDSDSEVAEFWEPPIGDRWDFDDGRDRWGSSSDTGQDTDEEQSECP